MSEGKLFLIGREEVVTPFRCPASQSSGSYIYYLNTQVNDQGCLHPGPMARKEKVLNHVPRQFSALHGG